MADGKKVYTLNINGVQESIDAVNSLLGQLDKLESKMDELSKKNIVVNTSGGGNKAVSELDAQEKLQRKIIDNADKIAMARNKDYEVILRQKEKLKEITSEQKATLAQAQLTNKEYSNTMQGLKQRLADIKAVLQVADLNDTDAFEKLTKEANELNQKLKDIEYSYGQFGRNVGNYQSAAEGFKKFSIVVNGVTREFDSAKQALMELRKESDTLRAMGEDVGDLDEKVKGLDSTLKDLKKSSLVLDNMLDMMESFASMASVGQGFKSLFGIENEDLEKGIQKLLALQNVLQGIEKINMQIKTGEGLGKYFSGMAKSVDKATASIIANNKALQGTGAASKVAVWGIKALGTALKAIPVMAAIWAITELVSWLGKLGDKKKDVDELNDSLKEVGEASTKSFTQGEAKLRVFQARIKNFNGNAKDEKKLVDELNSALGDRMGHYKSIKEWQEALIKLSPKYLEMLKNEAEVTALMEKYGELRLKQIEAEDEYRKLRDNPEYTTYMTGQKVKSEDWLKKLSEAVDKLNEANKATSEFGKRLEAAGAKGQQMAEEIAKGIKDLGGDIGDDANKSVDKVKETYDQAAKDLIKRRIDNMKDGLNKVLAQLQIDENQELAKISKAEHLKGERELEIQKEYQNKKIDAIKEYSKKAQEAIVEAARFENKALIQSLNNQMTENERNFSKELDEWKKKFQSSFSRLPLDTSMIDIKSLSELLGFEVNEKDFDDLRQYISLLEKVKWWENQLEMANNMFGEESDSTKKATENLSKYRNELAKFLNDHQKLASEFDSGVINEKTVKMMEYIYGTNIQNYIKGNEEFSEFVEKRLLGYSLYLRQMEKLKNKHIDEMADLEKKQLAAEYETNLPEEEKKRFQEITNEYEEIQKNLSAAMETELTLNETAYKEGLKSQEQYEKAKNNIYNKYWTEYIKSTGNYYKRLSEDDKEFQNKLKAIDDKAEEEKKGNLKERLEAEEEMYNETYNTLADMVAAAENKMLDTQSIENLKATLRRQLNDLLAAKMELKEKLDANEIKPEELTVSIDGLEKQIQEILRLLNRLENRGGGNRKKDPIGEFLAKINPYAQAILGAFSNIMASFDELEDYYLEKEVDAIDKQNEILEKKLDENEEILEKHKSNVESIEDELETARSDRRNHLIDQLNQEIEAQREAAKEQQRIEKEQEALERQKEAMERQREQKQYEANLKQMQISGIMSILNAFATQPFLPMGAALGAAQTIAVAIQIANAKKMKPYESGGQLDGGVAVGKRHKDGGIPVLGGRSVIEGGEFITNRRSTAKNLDVLSFINSSKKRLNLDDFIEFYNKPKAVIRQLSPRFEDGGQLGDLDIRDSLNNAIVIDKGDYKVSVVEILDSVDHLRKVQAIAGLVPNKSI